MNTETKKAVLSLSGGMDSSTVLIHLLSKGYEVKAIAFNYGQKHSMELERAKSLWDFLVSKELVQTENFHLLEIPLQDLIHSSLIKGGEEVPEGHYKEENMKSTVVPNRNKIFSSIIQSVALSWATETSSRVDIAMGIHAGDHAIYPDCRQEFRDADFNAFVIGNWDAEKVVITTPYLNTNKEGILYDGMLCCDALGIDFDEVYKRTNTSYKPICIDGVWYSDFKSASSVERIEAFINLELQDPVTYADENGPVSWQTAKEHVQQVLIENTKKND